MARVKLNHFNIPPLAGLCEYEDAFRIGYEVDYNVKLLKRYNYVKSQLNKTYAAHIARTPEWEVKCGFSHHMWLEAEHSASLRKRVSEMREPPLHLDKVPDTRLQTLMDEVIRAENTLELLIGIYQIVKPELIRSMKKHLRETNPLTDYPTCRIIKLIVLEEEEMVSWGNKAIIGMMMKEKGTVDNNICEDPWYQHLQAFLYDAEGISGDLVNLNNLTIPMPRSDGKPYKMNVVPARDERFKDIYNSSAKPTRYFEDETRPVDERVYALLYKRLTEMDVPEWMGPIIYNTKGKPWEYYSDMSRQLWDECRHAMMGEVGLAREGIPFYQYPVNASFSTVLNTKLNPLQTHTILWFIEQNLMPKSTGKHKEWIVAKNSDNILAAMFQDYDWADEILHAQIGRKWLLPEYGTLGQMKKAANQIYETLPEISQHMGAKSNHEEWWDTFIAEIREKRDNSSK